MLVEKNIEKFLVFVILLGMSREKSPLPPPPIKARKGKFVIVGR
jgi:hypothetical protein